MKILNFGSLNIDIAYEVEHMVRAGETISSRSRSVFAGGKGLNQSIALARAGARVHHAGAVGAKDGQFLLDVLSKNEINTDDIVILEDEATGHAIITVDQSGQNSIILYGGANQNISRSQVDKTLAGFGVGDFLLLQNEISELPYIVTKAHDRGMKIILNPSPISQTIRELDLSMITYLIFNEIEGAELTGQTQAQQILDTLLKAHPRLNLILTLGSKGAIYRDRHQELHQAAFPVKAIDTTAAGDTFTGYFFAALSRDLSVREALLLAAGASALAVTRSGAEASIPELEEVRRELTAKGLL